MNFVAVFMAFFSLLGAIDLIFGNKFGLGKEFEKGFHLLGTMALSMIGMIALAPFIGELLKPAFDVFYNALGLDPSVLPAMLLANDMGGAPLSYAVAKDAALGAFNGLIVSAMMGVTISFTIPVAMQNVKKERHSPMFLGMLCGVVTIPIGCFVSGLMLKLPLLVLLYNLLPIILFSALIAVGLAFVPNLCIKIFSVFGKLIQLLVIIGLTLSVFTFLTKRTLPINLASFEEGAYICFNASAVMSGTFPFMFLLSKLLKKPFQKLAGLLKVQENSSFGLLSTLATSFTTFPVMNEMDEKGIVINSAFCISAAFTFAGHLAFTMAYDAAYIFPMIAGKVVAGVCALFVALWIYKRTHKENVSC